MKIVSTVLSHATKVALFWESLKEKKLMGTRCKDCQTLFCPPRAICSNCLSNELEWVELSGNGKVVTYTVIAVAPSGFENLAPYVVAVVKLDEGPQITGNLVGIKPEEVKIEMRVEVVFETSQDGKPIYKFRPVS